MPWRRIRSVSKLIAKAIVGLIALILILVGVVLLVIETGWAKNRIRELIVRQANEYLTATLSIGRLEGSLLRGIRLGEVSVGRGNQTLIHVDEIAFRYSIRELVQRGVVIREVRLVRPRIVGAKQPDGKWDLGSLVKRESREQERTGPSRPIEVQSIQIVDGHISLRDPLDFGAAHVPTDFEALNATFRFAYFPVRWRLAFDRVSWIGHAPNLTVTKLAGTMGHGPGGWFFEKFAVETPRSAFVLAGRINRDRDPTELDLQAIASRFAFQEWSGVLRGLKDIAVESAFDVSLKGPVTAIDTTLRLTGTGGNVRAKLSLDTTVPGWHTSGAVDIERLNLARWLNRKDRPSDITGHVTLDLALELGRHFPRGVYAFNGPHAMYMDYAADAVRARGQITEAAVLVGDAAAVAYGAAVTLTDGSIGIDSPFPFHFVGKTARVDLRKLPRPIPVPHVDSVLAFDYDVRGRFTEPFIAGSAVFGRSEFLGAAIGSGTTGTIDTSQHIVRYGGEGDVEALSLRRFGEGLDVGWMRDPRFASLVAGHFRVEGAGTDAATMTLTGGGRLSRATAFKGTLSNAEVSVEIADGTLRASYDGDFATIDPAVPFDDERYRASLTGSGRMTLIAHDLLTQTTTLDDYDVQGTLALQSSSVGALHIDRGSLEATLAKSVLTVTRADLSGPEIEGTGQGTVGIGENTSTNFAYDLTRVDLARLRELTGVQMSGTAATKGRLTGPLAALRAEGAATMTAVDANDFHADSLELDSYDAAAPNGDFASARGAIKGEATGLKVGGQALEHAAGSAALDQRMVTFDLAVVEREGRQGSATGTVLVHPEERTAEVTALALKLGPVPAAINASGAWRIPQGTSTVVRWSTTGVAITPVDLVYDSEQRIGLSGDWRTDGSGALRIKATHVFLDTLGGLFEQPARYGGVLDLDATVRGTRDDPRVAATLTVNSGRVERVNYQQLAGTIDYSAQNLGIDLRLDQSPGIFVTAAGKVPVSLLRRQDSEDPIDVTLKSSSVNLGLLGGLTDVIRDVAGTMNVDVRAVGTSKDPHFTGSVTLANAAFRVTSTGSAYKNGRVGLTLTADRVAVDSFHLEDVNGRTLEVRGSLGTHELRVGELEIEATARRFEVLRNEFGRIELEGALQLRGRAESPQLTGDLVMTAGELKVDEILQQTLYRPYATEEISAAPLDPLAALNPWDRLALNMSVKIRNSLRLTGSNVQVSAGTPLGLGLDLRTDGNLYFVKGAGTPQDPHPPLYVNGELYRFTGTSTFQSRRFDVDPASSVVFNSDYADPNVDVGLSRIISGVETRIRISRIIGQNVTPELHLSSTPPLDESDIMSLIVFGISTNQLSGAQQQELLVRAGTLAAGMIATPLVQAIQREIGLDVLALEPEGAFGGGPRLTVGEEIAPGLVARFSRQFGPDPYDEATLEYALSRILSIRATFSDAESVNARAPFRRNERAGIDLLFFFSF